jgi:hypothetical protein
MVAVTVVQRAQRKTNILDVMEELCFGPLSIVTDFAVNMAGTIVCGYGLSFIHPVGLKHLCVLCVWSLICCVFDMCDVCVSCVWLLICCVFDACDVCMVAHLLCVRCVCIVCMVAHLLCV